MEFRKVCKLTIYTGEDVLLDDKPFYKAVVNKTKELGLGGATVVMGKSGFAITKRGAESAMSKFFSGNYNAPMIIIIIDLREHIEKILPFLEQHAAHSLVTLSETEILITDYLRQKFKYYKE